MSESLSCWNCGSDLADLPLPLSRHDHCEACGEPVHCCRMCRHYDRHAAEQCREDRADVPANKETANFCEFFSPNPGRGRAEPDSAAARAKAQLDALFGGGDPPE